MLNYKFVNKIKQRQKELQLDQVHQQFDVEIESTKIVELVGLKMFAALMVIASCDEIESNTTRDMFDFIELNGINWQQSDCAHIKQSSMVLSWLFFVSIKQSYYSYL